MPVQDWLPMVERVPRRSLEEAESDLGLLIRRIIHLHHRPCLLMREDVPYAALVSIRDTAVLQALDEHPEILELLEEKVGVSFYFPVPCSGGK